MLLSDHFSLLTLIVPWVISRRKSYTVLFSRKKKRKSGDSFTPATCNCRLIWLAQAQLVNLIYFSIVMLLKFIYFIYLEIHVYNYMLFDAIKSTIFYFTSSSVKFHIAVDKYCIEYRLHIFA